MTIEAKKTYLFGLYERKLDLPENNMLTIKSVLSHIPFSQEREIYKIIQPDNVEVRRPDSWYEGSYLYSNVNRKKINKIQVQKSLTDILLGNKTRFKWTRSY